MIFPNFIMEDDKTKKQLLRELKELRKRIVEYEESVSDKLTGLHNIRHFLILAEHEYERAHRYERPLSFVTLGINNIKQIKKIYANEIVDQVLITVAERFRMSVRTVDIIGRYRDDVFVLILPEANLTHAKKIADRIRRAVSNAPISTDSGLVAIKVSLGVAKITVNTPNLSALMYSADKAMKAAQERGGDRVGVG